MEVDVRPQHHDTPVSLQPLAAEAPIELPPSDVLPSVQAAQGIGEASSAGTIYLLLRQAFDTPLAREAGWRLESSADPARMWLHARNRYASTPQQGWKLHVSAGVVSAREVLSRALPVLLSENSQFKVAATLEKLRDMNQGFNGHSQVGKFITVYPNDDAQAVRLAAALDEATRGLRGPAVPSDRPLRAGSLVHYRYGGFTQQLVNTQVGRVVAAIVSPDGELVPDLRAAVYHCPAWAIDPFIEAGVASEPEAPNLLLGGRFLMLLPAMHRSARGAVYQGVDLDTARECVLKQASRDASLDALGRDARDCLHNEARLLSRLGPDPRFPEVMGLVEDGDELYLAMEYVQGHTLEDVVRTLTVEEGCVPLPRVLDWARQLAAMLDTVHAKGIVYRDLKSTNVIVAPEGVLRLIDLGLAFEPDGGEAQYAFGTRGYMSPQQTAGERATPADDVYGLGALIYYMATSAEPSLAPHELSLLERPLDMLRPGAPPALNAIVTRCLEHDPRQRFNHVAEIEAALAAIEAVDAHMGNGLTYQRQSATRPTTAETPRASRSRFLEWAYGLGEALCASATQDRHGHGLAWVSTRDSGTGIRSRNLNTGSSGPVLALAEMALQFGAERHRETLVEAARWLVEGEHAGGQPLPGLYVGESGVGAALLRAGQALRRADLISAAEERAWWAARQPNKSPDLFNGVAGRLRFHLMLWDETSDPAQLHLAVEAGEWLVEAAHGDEHDGLYWVSHPEFGGQLFLGYAHGVAGIADALLDLVETTGDGRFLRAARGAAEWLARRAVEVRGPDGGLNWPRIEGGSLNDPFWCHGSAGIGRFFMHAAQLHLLPEAASIADRAARSAAMNARWAGPTQCHGLAGNIEFLLDMGQYSGDDTYFEQADLLAAVLATHATERDGVLLWHSESPASFTPDYMTGYSGVAMCLLRLADPRHRPHQLSRQGFRYPAD